MFSVKTAVDVIDFIKADERLMSLLEVIDEIQAPDCWVAAGAIRNPIWADLHDIPFDPNLENDVDVIYFDRRDTSRNAEKTYEMALNVIDSSIDWEVRNQARMHLRNSDAPYRDCYHALEHWSETPTAIGARIDNGDVEILIPFGVHDLVNLIVQPTPNFHHKRQIYTERISNKMWAQKWPKLEIF